jgi:hypothetical protein
LRPTLMLFAALCTACVAPPRPVQGRFEVLGMEGGVRTFRYTARADHVYPENTSEGEAARRRWLEDYMLEAPVCRHDFSVVAREVVSGGREVSYLGRCKPAP